MTDEAPPPKSLEQRRVALRKANTIRSSRALLKAEIKTREKQLSPFIAEPPWWLESAKIRDMLIAVPGWGEKRVNRLLTRESISPSRTVKGLSDRQRAAVLRVLAGR